MVNSKPVQKARVVGSVTRQQYPGIFADMFTATDAGCFFISLTDFRSHRIGPTDDDAPSVIRNSDQSQNVPIVIDPSAARPGICRNTQPNLRCLAHAMQADYIEQDVVLSKDGVPVVMHDLTLDDVTNVAAVFPNRSRADNHWYAFDFTLEESRRHPELPSDVLRGVLGRTRAHGFPLESGHFRISTLAEHLQLIQGLNKSRLARGWRRCTD